MISDLVAALVAPELLRADGAQLVQLHEVVDGHEDQHRQRPLGIVGAILLLHKARANEEVAKAIPVCFVVEVLPLLVFQLHVIATLFEEVLLRLRLPAVVEAEAEAFLAVQVESHEPEDAEERANGTLILFEAGSARRGALGDGTRRCGLGGVGLVLLGVDEAVEPQLREGHGDVVVELACVVAGAPQLLSGAPGARPIRGLALHKAMDQQLVRAPHRQGLRQSHLALLVDPAFHQRSQAPARIAPGG
mmetsp:Transcript_52745/g.126211  ORF Transcript_52745/g.126211 Transcript_52745/m.126211 type:complete len:248 (+) Transcript_52745:1071-1814(+)